MKKTIRAVFVSSFPPKPCGVGEFCKNLIDNIKKNKIAKCSVFAINDTKEGYEYQSVVSKSFYFESKEAYKQMGKKINNNIADVCLIQHEIGLFGGEKGEFLLELLKNISVPIVIIVHNTSSQFFEHFKKIQKYTSKFAVLSNSGKKDLIRYGIAPRKITVLPICVPKIKIYKRRQQKRTPFIVSTFGLMRQKKGVEYLLRAIKQTHDINCQAWVIGQQHPKEATSYLIRMKKLAKDFGIASKVKFFDYYVSNKELRRLIARSDILVMPYTRKRRDQVSSSVLIHGVMGGIPIISTPFRHAKEVLGKSGILVPFEDPQKIATEIRKLVTNREYYQKIQKSTQLLQNTYFWENAASEYKKLFEGVAKFNAH